MTTASPIVFRDPPRPLLVYILGWGRSGSSIVANILGSLPDAASLGEVRYLWDRGLLENGICGCGAAFADCDFWPGLSAGDRPLAAVPQARAQALARSIGSGARPWQIPALRGTRARYFKENRADIDTLMHVYASAFEAGGSRVLIDASKSPFYALNLLHPEAPFDVAFLHLVRDPRAVLHAWKKTKKRADRADDRLFPKYSSTRSLLQWAIVNAHCERLAQLVPGRYFRIRYEDFAENWHAVLLSGAAPLFERSGTAVPPGGRVAMVHPQHSISGNPSRFSVGEVTLEPDTSWRDAITGMDRRLAAMICGSVAGRYGYLMR